MQNDYERNEEGTNLGVDRARMFADLKEAAGAYSDELREASKYGTGDFAYVGGE